MIGANPYFAHMLYYSIANTNNNQAFLLIFLSRSLFLSYLISSTKHAKESIWTTMETEPASNAEIIIE